MNKYILSIEKFDQFKQYVDSLPEEEQIHLLFHTYKPLIDSNSFEYGPLIVSEYRYLADIFFHFAADYLEFVSHSDSSFPSLNTILNACGDNLDTLWHYPGLKSKLENYMQKK